MKTKKFLSVMLAMTMIIGMMVTFNITASAGKLMTENECDLDLETSTTNIPDNASFNQNYTLTETTGGSTDVTKVKLSWEITDINVTRTANKVWDTENLCWKDGTSTTEITQAGSAKFTLENYSSVKVDAKVTFDTVEYEAGKKFTAPTLEFDETTGTDGILTIDTANGNSTYSKTNVPKGVIEVTTTPVANDFTTLAKTTTATKYGSYTVTIKEQEKIATTFEFAKFFDGTAGNATVNGKTASQLCQYMVDHDMITDASEFGDVLVKSTYCSKMGIKTTSKALSLMFDTTHQEAVNVTSDNMCGDSDYTMDKVYFDNFNGTFTWDGSAFVMDNSAT